MSHGSYGWMSPKVSYPLADDDGFGIQVGFAFKLLASFIFYGFLDCSSELISVSEGGFKEDLFIPIPIEG